MATFEEKAREYYEGGGMLPNQVEGAMTHLKGLIEEASPGFDLESKVCDYSEQVWGTFHSWARIAALEWIDENSPNAWYRAAFAGE